MTEPKVDEPMRVPRSKLRAPLLSRPVIDRTWLFRRPVGPPEGPPGTGGRDETGTDVPVTLLSAPAGSGKTTLMSGWAQDRLAHGHAVAWVSLDDTDNDPVLFWAGVLAALRPTAGAADAAGPPADREHPLVQLELVVRGSRTPVWLFLDDLQELTSPDVLADVTALLRGLPEQLRLVLATRRDPAVALHRLRLAGRLREIRAADLALHPAEVRQVLLDHGVRLAAPSLDLLVDRTEGWAAGVRLAALTLAGAADPELVVQDFAGDDRAVADYLTAEVLDRLGPGDRALLRSCAVPEQLSGDLAVVLTGDLHAAGLLDRLCQGNVLVVRLEAPPGGYRMHPLLRGYLMGELRRTDPDLLGRVHARAAEWFGQRGDPLRAIGHGVASGDEELADRLLVRHGPSLLADGRVRALDRLIRSSSPAVQSGTAVHELALLVSLELGTPLRPHIPRPRDPSDDDQANPDQPPPDAITTPLSALLSLGRVRHGDLAGSGSALAESAPVADDGSEDLGLLLVLNRGLVALLAGALPAAGQELTAAARRAAGLGNDHALLQASAGLTALASSSGDYRGAWRLADETIRVAARVPAFRGVEIATALHQAAQTRHQQLDPDGARLLAERAWSAMAGVTEPNLELPLTALVAVLDVEDGREPADAVRRMRRSWERADSQQVPGLLVAHLAFVQHRCSWLVGRPDWAREALGELRRRVEGVAEPEVLTATEHFARGRGEAARRRLAPVLDGSLPCAHPLSLERAWLVEAVVSARSGQGARAHEALQAALVIADELGALRPFVEMPGVPELLDEDVSRFGRLDHLVEQVRAADRQRSAASVVPLTPKELALLTDLPTQLTLEEIAVRHQVSVNTVKTHVRSIYLKLGVQSRRAAIASARRRGLL